MINLENNTFQCIELVKPRYFGVCCKCAEAWLLNQKTPGKYVEWKCPHCEENLIVKSLGKVITVADIQKKIKKSVIRGLLTLEVVI